MTIPEQSNALSFEVQPSDSDRINALLEVASQHPNNVRSHIMLALALEDSNDLDQLRRALAVRLHIRDCLGAENSANLIRIQELQGLLGSQNDGFDEAQEHQLKNKYDLNQLAEFIKSAEENGDLEMAIKGQRILVERIEMEEGLSFSEDPEPVVRYIELLLDGKQIVEAQDWVKKLNEWGIDIDQYGLSSIMLSEGFSGKSNTHPRRSNFQSYNEVTDRNIDSVGFRHLLKLSSQARHKEDWTSFQFLVRDAVNKLDKEKGGIKEDPQPALWLAFAYIQNGFPQKAQRIYDELGLACVASDQIPVAGLDYGLLSMSDMCEMTIEQLIVLNDRAYREGNKSKKMTILEVLVDKIRERDGDLSKDKKYPRQLANLYNDADRRDDAAYLFAEMDGNLSPSKKTLTYDDSSAYEHEWYESLRVNPTKLLENEDYKYVDSDDLFYTLGTALKGRHFEAAFIYYQELVKREELFDRINEFDDLIIPKNYRGPLPKYDMRIIELHAETHLNRGNIDPYMQLLEYKIFIEPGQNFQRQVKLSELYEQKGELKKAYLLREQAKKEGYESDENDQEMQRLFQLITGAKKTQYSCQIVAKISHYSDLNPEIVSDHSIAVLKKYLTAAQSDENLTYVILILEELVTRYRSGANHGIRNNSSYFKDLAFYLKKAERYREAELIYQELEEAEMLLEDDYVEWQVIKKLGEEAKEVAENDKISLIPSDPGQRPVLKKRAMKSKKKRRRR